DTFDKHIRIKNLELPPGVKILADPEEMVASVIPPRTEEELKALEEKPEEKVEEVEVAKEGEVSAPTEGEIGVPTPDKDRDVGKGSPK
ncbi:MAG: hypothetical protein COU82_01355, partial [Candidatus Portnoybacteria bacterium CG10_big_fil_rev_8_21_14_0_10_38_18]